jgi:Protein of unknown function (DUF2490)
MKYLLLLILLPFSVIAEEEHLFGQWTAAFINGKFGKDSPWNYLLEANLRSSQYPKSFNNNSYDIGSVPLRIGFGYNIDKENSVMLGYLYQYSQPPSAKFDVNENRAWQQYQNVQDFKEDGKLQLRTRFEQRTIEEGYGTALRFRQQAKYMYPIVKDWAFVISEELFVNCNSVSWGPVAGIDQNRLFIGPSYQINNDVRIEVGYQNVFINKDLVDDQMNHLIGFNVYYNVPD